MPNYFFVEFCFLFFHVLIWPKASRIRRGIVSHDSKERKDLSVVIRDLALPDGERYPIPTSTYVVDGPLFIESFLFFTSL